MSASNDNESGSSSANANSTANSPEDGLSADSPIREFLYLDFPKLTSYHAQFSKGLLTKSEHYEDYDATDDIKGKSVDATVEAGGGVKLGDADLAATNLLKLLGLASRIDAKLSFLIRGGSKNFTFTETTYEIATKELHHEIFTDIEDAFAVQNLISYNNDDDFNKPFHVITGYADFIDFNHLAASIVDFENLRQNLATISNQPDLVDKVEHPDALSAMIKKFYKDRLAVLVGYDDFLASAYLDAELLSASMSFINDNYGRVTQIPITLFGLKVGEAYPVEETSGTESFQIPAEDFFPNSKLGLFARSIVQANRGLEGMDRFFRVRGDLHLYPIAIYIDLEGLSDIDPKNESTN